MSRAYTNREGEYVEVSKEHLDASVLIYEELAKQSPSRRVSWARHKKMMEDNGFEDSENSEAYRQLVKFERKSRGILPTVESHANMLADGKLELLKDELGNLYHAKREMQLHSNSLNKTRRDLSLSVLMTEMVRDALQGVDWGLGEATGYVPEPIDKGDVVSVSNLSDIHHGYLADDETDARAVTEARLHSYLKNLVRFGKKEGVNHFIIVNLGDTIEGQLRSASLIDTRQLAVEQMVEASELISVFLKQLKDSGFKVSYLVLAGNHDRINMNKNDAMDKEDYAVMHKAIMKMSCEKIGVEYIDTPNHYYHILEVNGVNMYLAHGDRDAIKSDKLLAELSSLHNVLLDIVMVGHFHTTKILETGDNKFQVITGAIKGSDKFSSKINKASSRSQLSILIDEKGFDIRKIMV